MSGRYRPCTRRGLGIAGWLLLGCGVVSVLLTGPASEVHAKCRSRNVRKIRKLANKALEDYQMLEIKSALKRIIRAIDHGIDNDCDEKLAFARALMVRGIIHLAGQQDQTRGALYLEKAIRANPCVKLEPGQPPSVVKVWSRLRKRHKNLKCGSRRPGPVEPPPERRTTTKPCSHRPVDEAQASKPVTMVVDVQPNVGAMKVVVRYRPHGEASFVRLQLARPSSGTSWTGSIPGKDVHGTRLAYYIEVLGPGNRLLCKPTSASAGAPEIIMVKGDPCTNLPPDFCDTNESHRCCKNRTSGTGGRGSGSRFARFYINFGFATGFGYLSTSMLSFRESRPYSAGLALGPLGAQAELGYFLARRHLLSLAGRFGLALSETSDTPVISWQALLRYRFFLVGVKPKDLFGLYLGVELGGGQLYHSLVVQTADGNKRDTFDHGYVIAGALLGIRIGVELISWYLEIDPVGIFPRQPTFHLGLSSGLAIRF